MKIRDVVLLALLVPWRPSAAAWDLELGVVSDYLTYGISQTDGRPAPQLGCGWSQPSGLHADAWCSTVDYGDDTWLEADLGAGWAGETGGLGWDLVIQRYHYLGSTRTGNYSELALNLERGPLALLGSWTPDYAGSGADAAYGRLALALPLAHWVGGVASLGAMRHSTSAAQQLYGSGADRLMTDWSLGLAGDLSFLAWSLAWHDTDSRGRRAAGDLAGRRLVLSVSWSLSSGE
jgi:uncharacterized protein (TIGR02001 family)